ncbi:MAG: phage major capsid protein [Nitrosospira sp.]|nr:phage major capsid protein [Nitrosospira sp.]
MKEPVDLLRPWSVTARAGMLVETGLRGNLAVPKVSGKTTPSWVATESAQVAPSQPTLSQIAMTPKTLGNVVVFSRQLGLQANADQFVGRELLRSIGTALDQAVLNGSGTSGQPLGILNTTGIQTQSGATLNSGAWSMKQKTSEANANDEQISFISTPAVRALLETRERATGGGRFVWQEDKVADRPAHVTTDMPSGVMACGGWALIYLGIWGSGFTLEINPYDQTGFKSGLIQARMLISCDVAVLHPSAFVKADGIT